MMSACFSTAKSAMTYAVASTMASTPASRAPFTLPQPPPMASAPLANLFPDRAGRAPGHEHDDNGEGEHVLVGTGKRQRGGADGLQCREQKAAEDGAIDRAKPADDGRGKA